MPIAIIPMAHVYNWDLHAKGWILSAFAFGYFTSQLLGMKPIEVLFQFYKFILDLQQVVGLHDWVQRMY